MRTFPTFVIAISLLMIALASAAVRRDAKQEVLAAVGKLADADSYSWSTTSERHAAGGSSGSEGKTQKDGLTWLSLSLRDGAVQLIFKGDRAAVATPEDGWKSLAEIEAAGDAAPRAARVAAGLFKNYRPPAAQAMSLVSQAQDLTKTDDGAYTGTLSPADASALIQRRVLRDAQADTDLKDPKATVSFWTENGQLTRFQFHVEGTLAAVGGDMPINRTTTVEVKDVGTTKIEVPDEAKAKMG